MTDSDLKIDKIIDNVKTEEIQAEVLLASSYLDDLISEEQEASLVDYIFSKQSPDGGWSLFSLGSRALDGEFKWVRSDGTDQVTDNDGYATGYSVYVLKQAGISLEDERMKKAVNWLKSNQKRRWKLARELREQETQPRYEHRKIHG